MYTEKNLTYFDLMQIVVYLEEKQQNYLNEAEEEKANAEKYIFMKETYMQIAEYYKEQAKQIETIIKKIKVE